MSIVLAADCTHANIGSLPPGLLPIGYTTGSPDIAWTEEDWADHPGALRIDQDFRASDPTADYLDVENGAATFADCPGWAKQAMADYNAVRRPGQRKPAIYMSANNVTNVANALVAGGVNFPVGLVIANWNLSEAQAALDVLAGDSGPFPIVGIQFRDPGPYDLDVFISDYVNTVSHHNPPPPPGLHRHVTGKGESIDSVARARGANPVELATRSIEHYTPADVQDILHVVTKQVDALLSVKAAGIPYYTINP